MTRTVHQIGIPPFKALNSFLAYATGEERIEANPSLPIAGAVDASGHDDAARAVALPFRWRDRAGAFHDPKAMESRHLFHTISMIWNHVMPPEARTHDYNRYSFSTFYTQKYMLSAVRVMLPELLSRDDLKPEWKQRLNFMKGWLQAQDGVEIQVLSVPQTQIAHDKAGTA